jgi:hypothetical protein
MGYANYFLLTFVLAFPAYALLPWIRTVIAQAEAQSTTEEAKAD